MEGKECTICDNPIMSKRGLINKTASCCGVMGQMHTTCAKKYYSAIYPEKKNHLVRDLGKIAQAYRCSAKNVELNVYSVRQRSIYWAMTILRLLLVRGNLAHIGLIIFLDPLLSLLVV